MEDTRDLGVNCRTMMNCCGSRRVRQGLVEFRDAGGVDEDGGDWDARGQNGDSTDEANPLEERVERWKARTGSCVSWVESQAGHLAELGCRIVELEQQEGQAGRC